MNNPKVYLTTGFFAIMLGVAACNTIDAEFNTDVYPKRIAFTADRQYPEGIAYAPTLERFLISSVTQGKVGAVDLSGRYSDLLTDSKLISGTGVKVREGKVYVCNADLGISDKSTAQTVHKTAGLLIFDLATRQLIRHVRLDSLRPTVPNARYLANDLAFDDAGNAYVTDSYAPVIYKVTPDYEASVLKDDPLFADDPQQLGRQQINLNGIVYHPDKFLLVVKSSTGELFRVDLVNIGKVDQVTGVVLPGGDGMVLANNNLYVVNGQNKVSQVSSSDGWKTASIVRTDSAGYSQATTNVSVNGRIYTINARIGEVSAAAASKDSNPLKSSDYSIQQFR